MIVFSRTLNLSTGSDLVFFDGFYGRTLVEHLNIFPGIAKNVPRMIHMCMKNIELKSMCSINFFLLFTYKTLISEPK
jgi:hypothetical protein